MLFADDSVTWKEIILALIGVAMLYLQNRARQLQNETKEAVKENTAITSSVASINLEATNSVVRKVEQVHLETNSMKDQLVEAVRVAATAVGEKIGREEQRAEDNKSRDDKVIEAVEDTKAAVEEIPDKVVEKLRDGN